jgi:exopolyphosphatase/pppGpp-phosphohydrolase
MASTRRWQDWWPTTWHLEAGGIMKSGGAGDAVVWLELLASAGRIRVDLDASTGAFPLPIGTSAVSALFRHDPPTEGELESAIELVEEAVMPLAKKMPRGSVLVASSERARELVNLSTGSVTSHVASLDAVESRFEQMALAARRGAWSREVRMDPSVCAGLLILREFMHHSGFDRIEVRDGVAFVADEAAG